jgi:hypothetical protein
MSDPIFFKIGAGPTVQTFAVESPRENWGVVAGQVRCTVCRQRVFFVWDSPPTTGVARCACNRENQRDWRRVLLGVLLDMEAN